MHGPIAHPVQMVALQSATPPLAALLQVQICPVSILSVRRSTSTGDKMYCSYALFLLSCSSIVCCVISVQTLCSVQTYAFVSSFMF